MGKGTSICAAARNAIGNEMIGMGEKRLKFEKQLDYYTVKNIKTKEELGVIGKHTQWDRWVWEQTPAVIMSRDCLKEVVEFMEKLGGKG